MKLTEFILPHCPYCLQAREVIAELRDERPEFAAVELDVIDESRHPDLADRHDYYRVPSFFLGERKLYEADPRWSREEVKKRLSAMFDELLGTNPDPA